MNRLIAAAFLVGALTGAGVANAMPLAPLAPAPGADVIEVAGGCGPGWHRGPYGGCRRNYANPRRIPARADGISDDTAVAAPTGRRDFDHLRLRAFSMLSNDLKTIRFPSWPGRSAKRVFALDVPAIHVFLAALALRRGCPAQGRA
jgi:hypothetical protein